jgi:hypothetical protein
MGSIIMSMHEMREPCNLSIELVDRIIRRCGTLPHSEKDGSLFAVVRLRRNLNVVVHIDGVVALLIRTTEVRRDFECLVLKHIRIQVIETTTKTRHTDPG